MDFERVSQVQRIPMVTLPLEYSKRMVPGIGPQNTLLWDNYERAQPVSIEELHKFWRVPTDQARP